MLRLALVLIATAGCVQTGVTTCPGDDKLICASGLECVILIEGGYACAAEGEPVCGDGMLTQSADGMPLEVCDATAGDSVGDCSPRCTLVECGDGIRDPSEDCDDGNAISNDGCDSACQTERPTVMVSIVRPPEVGPDAAGAFDARRGVTVIFGGGGMAGASQNTYELDPSGMWLDTDPRVSPPPRVNHAMAYDADLARVVMFGGRVASKPSSDLWFWDGSEWSVRSEVAPPQREGHAMAYDPRTRQIIVYGGYGGAVDLYDAWGWTDAGGWTQIDTTGVRLREPALVADPASGRLVLVGVAADDTLQTFTWSETGWTQQPWTFSPRLTETDLVSDPVHGDVLLVGNAAGTATQQVTHRLTDDGWTPLPANRLVRDSFTLVGSTTGALMIGGPLATPAELRFWTGSTWVDDLTSTVEDFDTRAESDVASDLLHHRLIGFTAGAQVLELQGARPRQVMTQGNPLDGAAAYRVAYHEGNGTLVVVTSTASGPVRTMVGTRIASGSNVAWSFERVSTGTGPERVTRLVYDAANERIVTQADQTWELIGTEWRVIPGEGPGALYNYSLAYDRVRRVVVLYGGETLPLGEYNGLTRDTWVLAGDQWQRQGMSAPTPRIKASFAYDMDRQALVLAGGLAGASSLLYDAWELTDAGWTELLLEGGFLVDSVVRTPTQVTAPDGVGLIAVGQIPIQLPDGTVVLAPALTRVLWTSGAPQEACQRVNADGDADVGCDEAACWHVCSPLCRPTNMDCMDGPSCGDGSPGEIEQCGVCIADAGACNTCGDLVCDPGETCPGDCF